MKKFLILQVVFALLLVACGVPQKEFDTIKNDMRTEIDGLEENLASMAEDNNEMYVQYNQVVKEYDQLEVLYENLDDRHQDLNDAFSIIVCQDHTWQEIANETCYAFGWLEESFDDPVWNLEYSWGYTVIWTDWVKGITEEECNYEEGLYDYSVLLIDGTENISMMLDVDHDCVILNPVWLDVSNFISSDTETSKASIKND